MYRIAITFVAIVLLVCSSGCDEISDITGGITSPSGSGGPQIVREAGISPGWAMKQMKIELSGGEQLSILLKLENGDRVDGYYYLEKGNDIDFNITGNALVYRSPEPGAQDTTGITSDRFSFVATQAQGSTYTLTFDNSASDTEQNIKATIFLEVIYPEDGSVFIPVDSN